MGNEIIYKYEPLWGEWKIEALIGKGSIGKVYKIVKEVYGKKYYSAVKMISIPTEDQYECFVNSIGEADEESIKSYFEDVVKNIVNEIDLLYSLKGHSSIISYEDHMIKEVGKSWYIFIRMEYAETLKNYLKDKKLDENDVIKLGIDICDALIACHNKGIIHRDIKEGNLFRSNSHDMFKLGDFSVSKDITNKTSLRTKVGTLNYMPPEIMKGNAYTKSVDIYCLGIVLYKLLNNGRLPFIQNNNLVKLTPTDLENAYIKRISGEKMKRPEHGSDKLVKSILKACEYDVDMRYNSAEDLKNDLQNCYYDKNDRVILDHSAVKIDTMAKSGTFNNQVGYKKSMNKTVNFGVFSTDFVYKDVNRKRKFIYIGVAAIIIIFAIIFSANIFLNSNGNRNAGKNNSKYGLETPKMETKKIKTNYTSSTATFIKAITPSITPSITLTTVTPTIADKTVESPNSTIVTPTKKTYITNGINLVNNYGFESGTTSWLEFSNTSDVISKVTSSESHSGSKSVEITDTKEAYTHIDQLISNKIVANKSYKFSCYIKTINMANVDKYGVKAIVRKGKTDFITDPIIKNQGWSYVEKICDIPSTETGSEAQIFLCNYQGGTAYFDDINIEEIVN